MISCILLSAGLSERFGSPKALADLSGQSAIQRLQNTLLQTTCDEIIIVLGAKHEKIRPSIFIHSRIRVVYNKHYNFGQTSSVQEGLKHLNESSLGFLFHPVDCPLIKASSIATIIQYFKENNSDILIPTFRSKKGHPPIFHQRLKSKILKLPMDQGLNSLFTEHPPQIIEINDPGIVKSFNTPEELKQINPL